MTTGVGEEEDEENLLDLIDGWQEDETHNPNVPAISHRRGLASFVFVPFDEVSCPVRKGTQSMVRVDVIHFSHVYSCT